MLPDKRCSMSQLQDDGVWHLFDPVDVPRLQATFGAEFDDAYRGYIEAGVAVSSIRATELWRCICDAQVESGTPFLMYHDNVNRRCKCRRRAMLANTGFPAQVAMHNVILA